MNNKKVMMLYALLIIPVMISLFTFFSSHYGKTIGYFLPYGMYLIILLIGTIWFCSKKEKVNNLEIEHQLLYYILAFVPVLATLLIAFLPIVRNLSPKLILFVLVYALLNGTLEELFWRFSFNKVFGNNIVLAYVIPTIVFSCWHFALLFAKGISYTGGAIALVGGASFMGMLWGFIMYKTKNVKVIICAHVLTNFFAFSQLIYENSLIK